MFELDAVMARDAATMLRNVAASAFHVPAGQLSEALNALELGAMTLDEHVALVAEVRAARECVHALRSAPMPLTEESRQVGATFLRLFDAWLSELALPTLNALDKVTGSGS